MKEITKICLIGDRLINFQQNNDVMTYSQLITHLNDKTNDEISQHPLVVVIGQGISDHKINLLNALIKNRSLENSVHVKRPITKMQRSSGHLTHKHKSANNMISTPELLGHGLYHSYLMLDDQCDEMSDHVTGQHLQGMLLIEAARQMTLAVTEKFYINELDRKNVAFVTNNLTTNFIGYVFPCEVRMIYKVVEHRKTSNINAKYKVLIQFVQNDEVKTEVTYDFSTIEKKFLYEKEQAMAQNTIKSYLSKYARVA